MYSECVTVILVTQHEKRMRRITLLTVTCPAVPYFVTLSHKRHAFRNKVIEHKMCVLIFSITFSEIFFILRRIQRYVTIIVHNPSCKVPVILVRFQ